MTQPETTGSHRWSEASRPTWATAGLILAVAIGIVLRLIFPADIEFKLDERWTFERVQQALSGGSWRSVGMPMSVGGPNPGLSLWVFILLGAVSGADTAPQLTTAVHVVNIVAILGFVAFVRFAIAAAGREPWYWAAALWSLNPLAIVLERKLWPPSILPVFVVAMIACWWHRGRALPAFGWGALGALIGQLHVGAWFFTLALLLWTLMHDRRLVNGWAWLAGNAAAGLLALPWLAESLLHRTESSLTLGLVPKVHFFIRWITQPFGFGIDYTLGRAEMWSYLSSPWVTGHATYLMGLVQLLTILLALAVALAAALRLYGGVPVSVRDTFIGRDDTGVLLRAAFWGYGTLLTLTTLLGVDSHRHYLIVVAPLMALWAARLVFWGDWTRLGRSPRAVLAAFCILQAAASAGLIGYIHVKQVIAGEYGPTWLSQQPGRSR